MRETEAGRLSYCEEVPPAAAGPSPVKHSFKDIWNERRLLDSSNNTFCLPQNCSTILSQIQTETSTSTASFHLHHARLCAHIGHIEALGFACSSNTTHESSSQLQKLQRQSSPVVPLCVCVLCAPEENKGKTAIYYWECKATHTTAAPPRRF